MTQGRFIQAGATASNTANDGYGEFMTVDRLDRLERDRIRKHLTENRPELLAEGIRVTRAKMDADAHAEKLRADLHGALGGDNVRVALLILKEDASKQAAAEAVKASQSTSKK